MKQKLKKIKKKRNEIVRFAQRFVYGELTINLFFHFFFSFIQLIINQITIVESIKTFSRFEKDSNSNLINKKKTFLLICSMK